MANIHILTKLRYSGWYTLTQYLIIEELLSFQTSAKLCFKSPDSIKEQLCVSKSEFYKSVRELKDIGIITYENVEGNHRWYVNEHLIEILYQFRQVLRNPESETYKLLLSVSSTRLESLVHETKKSRLRDLPVEEIKSSFTDSRQLSMTYRIENLDSPGSKSILRVSEEGSTYSLERASLLENESLWDVNRWNRFTDEIPDQFGTRRARSIAKRFEPLRLWLDYFAGPDNSIPDDEIRTLLDMLKDSRLRSSHLRDSVVCTSAPGELFSKIDLTSEFFLDFPVDAFGQLKNEHANKRRTILKRWAKANAINPDTDLRKLTELDEEAIDEIKGDRAYYGRTLETRKTRITSLLQDLNDTESFKITGNREGDGYEVETVIEIAGYFAVRNDTNTFAKILNDNSNDELQQGRYIAHTLAAHHALIEVLESHKLFEVIARHYDFTVDDVLHARKQIHDSIREEAKALDTELPSFKELNKGTIIQHDFSQARSKRQVN